MRNWVFVDCEARGPSPVAGTLTEFGAVHWTTRATFHGRLYETAPDPDVPAIPVVGARLAADAEVAAAFAAWLAAQCGTARPTFVSDNPAYDWQWVAALFAVAGLANPFGHSGRRIGDMWAGLTRNLADAQSWKRLRVTPHDHNPVNDALGNVEAVERMLQRFPSEGKVV